MGARATSVEAIGLAGIAILLQLGCVGDVTYYGNDHDEVDGALAADAGVEWDGEGLDGQQSDPADGAVEVDAIAWAPLEFNIIVRQTVQACSGCGIWFDWQGVQAQKPRLVIEYREGEESRTATYQHGLDGMDNGHGFYLGVGGGGAKHSMLIKQTPQYTGLFRADISDIPPTASILSATLHLHIETDEGLAYSDLSSVLEVHRCDHPWDWDEATWTQYAAGQSWTTAGGDFGRFVRQIRAKEDIRDRGFSKANPDAYFDFTTYVQELQAAR